VLLQQSIGLLQQTIFFDPPPLDATSVVLTSFLFFRTVPV